MSLTAASPRHFEQYRASGDIPVHPPYKAHPRRKPALSRNPVERVLQSESTPSPRKVRFMAGTKKGNHSRIPMAASSWTKKTLDLLNATYDSTANTPFAFEGLKLPDELQNVVNHVADQLANVNNSNSITCEFDFEPTDHPSLSPFETFYELFLQVLTKQKVDTPPVLATVPPPSRHSSPSAESTSSFAKSTSTGVSQPQSTSSGASKPEHYTQGAAAAFLLNTYQTVKKPIAGSAWWNEGKIGKGYKFRFSLIQQDMKVELGPKDNKGSPLITLVARSDGGCSFTVDRKYDRDFAAIPIEAKRKKTNLLDKGDGRQKNKEKIEECYQKHAAQIYAEMLGVVCHKALYDGNPKDPEGCQESFVIHARHATFYLFYAKFPNQYLRDIAKYADEYTTKAVQPHKIVIQQSRPFRMKEPRDQAEFYKLLSKLLYYLVSGQSYVGFLAAQKWNKHYRLAVEGLQKPQLYDCIVVRPSDEEPKILDEKVWKEEGENLLEECDPTDVDDSMMDDTTRSVISSACGTYAGSPAGSLFFDSRGGSPMLIDEE